MLGIIILTLIALFFSLILALVDYFSNREDPKVRELEKLLPKLNCGNCGFGTCKGLACEILKDKGIYINCKNLKDTEQEKLKKY